MPPSRLTESPKVKPAERLPPADRDALLAELPAWRQVDGRDAICREAKFADFAAAWACMTRIALLAERTDHHPEWSNTYASLRIVLTTHDAGGLSARDAEMARRIEPWLPPA